jgi:2,5-diamino-6-(ribosylamino)-4(3H)-pyrimidinone 5'-phosphate reductase
MQTAYYSLYTARHLPPRSIPYPQPRPIILDAELRFNPSCNLILNVEKGAPPPWIFASSAGLNQRGIEAFMFRKRVLESGGVKVIEVPLESQRGHSGGGPRLSLPAVLGELHNLGIKSLMVEGGRSVIWSFLSERDSGGRPLIDSLVVTVAPILVGVNGFELSAEASRAENKVRRLLYCSHSLSG